MFIQEADLFKGLSQEVINSIGKIGTEVSYVESRGVSRIERIERGQVYV